MRFTCATCGKEIAPEEGTLSWRQVDGKLSGFRITHKRRIKTMAATLKMWPMSTSGS